MLHDRPDGRDIAVGQIFLAPRRVSGKPRQRRLGELAIEEGIHRVAIVGELDRGGEIIAPFERSEAVRCRLQPRDRARNADALARRVGQPLAAAAGILRPAAADLRILRMVELGVEIMIFFGLGLIIEDRDPARERRHLRFDYRLHRHCGQHGVERGAAFLHHLDHRLGHYGVRRGRHRRFGMNRGLRALFLRERGLREYHKPERDQQSIASIHFCDPLFHYRISRASNRPFGCFGG